MRASVQPDRPGAIGSEGSRTLGPLMSRTPPEISRCEPPGWPPLLLSLSAPSGLATTALSDPGPAWREAPGVPAAASVEAPPPPPSPVQAGDGSPGVQQRPPGLHS